jgi:capsular polysaccharide biosynthesis protein
VIYEPKVRFDELPIKHQFLGNCKKLSGTIAYLSNTLFCHYGHWVQTQLPLLLSYWETFGKENIDYYYIGDGVTKDFVEDSLVYMGVPKDRIINFPCKGDRSLISIKYRDADHGFKMDPFSHDFLKRSLFKPGPSSSNGSTPKRLFVLRGNVKVRKELNLPAIKEALTPMGFTFVSMDGKSMQDEATLFGNADVIIAVHGSALHNVVFARPETKVVEIFPYEYFEASNFFISNYGGCDYYYLIGEKTKELPEDISFSIRNDVDVLVDTKKLIALCEMALANK